MTFPAMRGVRRGMGVLAAGAMIFASEAAPAQVSQPSRLPPGAIVQPLENPAGTEHRRNLTALGNNPRSVSALVTAGRSAVALGDGQAAFQFFARADEIEPRNPRVKAGMASALVLLERGQQALAMFREAEALGAPAVEIARDRGLAHDMTGDPRRAQQDYAMVLRRGDDPEVRRRMALSLAISGQRQAALDMLADQLRQHDRAAWRTQAFVLALTGDTAGANQTAARMMPGGAAQSIAPFFARLAALNPAQKAMAVHFGSLPSNARGSAYANVDTSADPGALALAQRGAIPSPAAQPTERRRPERSVPARPSARELAGLGPIAPAVRRPETVRRFEPPRPEPEPIRSEPEPARFEPLPAQAEDVRETQLPDGSTLVEPGFTLAPGGTQSRIEPSAPPEPPPGPASAPVSTQSSASAGLGDLNSMLAGIDDGDAPPVAPPPARRAPTRSAEARPTPPRTATRRRPAVQPSRRWVQIATVTERSALSREFARLRIRAPEALRNRNPHSAPFGRSSSRLLVGPFDTAAAAQALVAQLRRGNVSAFAWTSEAGQEIDRVQTANDTRTARSRSEPAQRPGARGTAGRSTTARASRGRSQPEPRTPARRGRSN